MKRIVLCAVLFVFAVSATSGCASTPQYLFNEDGATDFDRYRTFGFFDEREPGRAAYQSVAHRHLKSAIVREMLARGYQRSERPQLLVNIHVQRRDDAPGEQGAGGAGSDYYSYRSGHYAWRAGAPTLFSNYGSSNYTDGTLNIDVVDSASRELLWEGIVVGSVSQRMYESLEPTIDRVVAKLFESFPKFPEKEPSHWSSRASNRTST